MITIYFLVILPLPDISLVRQMKAIKPQLIPFHFVVDIVKELRSFVEKLQLMGQIYEKAEESSVNSANQLPTNIIA